MSVGATCRMTSTISFIATELPMMPFSGVRGVGMDFAADVRMLS
jgi:hypothetical protein